MTKGEFFYVIIVSLTCLLESKVECTDVVHALEVKTPCGWVRGYKERYDETKIVHKFSKIPYAKPPIGKLRFKKTQPVNQWEGVQGSSARSKLPLCMQPSFAVMKINESDVTEDCLYLTIYVPGNISPDKNLSVMVWIHGGGFVIGGGNAFAAEKLSVEGNVIVVSLNYRLGLFGFLTLHDSVAAGNYGLWDQIEALKWIQKNIKSFGGNAGSVTIFGESSGGISAHLLSLIPTNKGLFQRVIAMSGTVSPLLFGKKAYEDRVKELLIERTECKSFQDNTEFLHCLQGIPANAILEVVSMYEFMKNDNMTVDRGGVIPTVDGELFTENPMFTMQDTSSDVHSFFTSIDFMSGTTSAEGSFLYMIISPDMQTHFKFNITEGIPRGFLCDVLAPVYVESSCGNIPEFSEAVCELYSNTENADEQCNKIAQMVADFTFTAPLLRALDTHAERNTKTMTYQYLFTKPSPQPLGPPPPAWFRGCGHADELYLLFPKLIENQDVIKEDHIYLSKQIIEYWTNFAKFGNPNSQHLPVWPAYDINKREFISFDTPISTDTNMFKDAIKLILTIIERGKVRNTHEEL